MHVWVRGLRLEILLIPWRGNFDHPDWISESPGLYLGTFEISLLTKALLQKDMTAVAVLFPPRPERLGLWALFSEDSRPVCSPSSCSKELSSPLPPPSHLPRKRAQLCAKHKFLRLKSQLFSLQTMWAVCFRLHLQWRILAFPPHFCYPAVSQVWGPGQLLSCWPRE